MTIWEISRTVLGGIRQANWRKTVCSTFLQSKKGAGSICSWLWSWQYSCFCPIRHHFSRTAKRAGPTPNRNSERWFVFLPGAALSDSAEPDNPVDGQGIWHLFSTYPAPWTCVLLWSDSGLGLAGGLQLLFPQGGQQPYQQLATEDEGSAGCAGLCEKRLWRRL